MDANEVVTGFCESFEKGDLDQSLSYLDANCRYHNIPLEPVEGVEAIRKPLKGLARS